MNEKRKSCRGPVLVAVIITATLTFWATNLLFGVKAWSDVFSQTVSNAVAARRGNESDVMKNLDNKLAEIKQYVDSYFIGREDIDNRKLTDAVASGMIAGLDDEWSYYISAEEYDAYLENINNAYVGIGVTISAENVEKGLEIVDVTPDSPAYQAGLQKGDVILAVEGTPVLDGSENSIDLIETKNRVRGKEGTNVTITISHEGVKRDVTITRSTIKTVNVTSKPLDNGLMYIRIRNFEQDAGVDIIEAVEAARKQNVKGIIFDVRFNPGGYKHELVKALDHLLPEGPLFRSVDYSGREEVDKSNASYVDLPMAVLVNYNSYSAAEFFAAALQEYEAATIVGEQTYGKGRFQTAFRLSDGSAINISIGQYTTPKGVSLVGKGVAPDCSVELTTEDQQKLYYDKLDAQDDAQLQKAIEVLTN